MMTPDQTRKASMYCTNCGSPLAPEARFCGNCGTSVYQPDDPPQDTSPATAESSAPASAAAQPAAAQPTPSAYPAYDPGILPPPGSPWTPPPPGAPPLLADESRPLILQSSPPQIRLSSAGKRLGAWALDGVLFVVTLGIGWLIWSLIVWSSGRSPAKQLLKMRVVRRDNQRSASWGRMCFREIVCKGIIGFAASLTVIGIAIYFWLLWDDERQELWDKMADTLVVNDPLNQLRTHG
jgi:uncharacterized RDD family membrane protein YckC